MDYPSKEKKERSKNINKKFIQNIFADYKLVITHEQEKLQKI